MSPDGYALALYACFRSTNQYRIDTSRQSEHRSIERNISAARVSWVASLQTLADPLSGTVTAQVQIPRTNVGRMLVGAGEERK
jgi:hypothetical protein